MLQEPEVLNVEAENESTTHFVYALRQFALSVRYRKNVVVVALVASILLGGLYYATARRYYGAKAVLLVLQAGGEVTDTSIEGTQQQDLMPTFEGLITSSKVLEGALSHLGPEDLRIEMENEPRGKWIEILEKNLYAKTIRDTKIIQVGYRSKNPNVAVNVVNAVVRSYMGFLDRTHKGTAGDIMQMLTTEHVELAGVLADKRAQVTRLRSELGDLGIRPGESVKPPSVQRALFFNEELIKTQYELERLDASLGAIRASVRNGEDLQQHVMAVADVVGEKMLLSGLGINTHDAGVQARIERDLLEQHASLKAMEEHLGPAHPEVIAKVNQIRTNEEYLREYPERVSRRLAEIQNDQLGPMLMDMVQQKLSETRQLEASLRVRFEQAQHEATDQVVRLAQLEYVERDLEWQRKLHDGLLEKITDIDLKQGGQDVRTAVLEDPVVSERPVSPSLRRVVLLVLVAGLGSGLLAVYAMDVLDDRFRSAEELQSQLGVPVLAMVQQLKTEKAGGLDALQMHVAPNAAESEAFRTLRTALALADREARRIVISSPEAGDGKTTVLANLAVAYAQSEKKTLLVDADLRRPGLTAMMGMRGVDGLSGIIRGKEDVAEMAAARIQASGIEHLDLLPTGPRPTNPAELLANPRFSELLEWAETIYDQILIDSPPALATSDAAVIGRLVDGVMLVIQPDKNRRRGVLRVVDGFAVLKVPVLGTIVNRVDSDNDRGYYGYCSGYGYGYSYGGGYTHDEEEPDADGRTAPDGFSQGDAHDTSDRKEMDQKAGFVPRRVA